MNEIIPTEALHENVMLLHYENGLFKQINA